MDKHLSQDLILRSLDDELTLAEKVESERHLASCEFCRRQAQSLRELSFNIEAAVQTSPVPDMTAVRENVRRVVEAPPAAVAILQNPAHVLRRFGWGMAVAAGLTIALLLAPKQESLPQVGSAQISDSAATRSQAVHSVPTIDVDGETFWPLPYSNAELATIAPHIVEMPVSLAALAEAGIVLEPAANGLETAPGAERTVLADVLMGADGQPRGVRVSSMD